MSDFVDRRAVLRSGAVATALGLAGCLSRLPGDDATPDGNQSDDDSEPDDGEDGESTVSSWPSFQYDAGNSGHAEGRGPRGDLTEAWTFEREGKMRGGPVVSEDGVVYIGSDEGTMYALDLEDGSLLWSTDTGDLLRRVPVIYGNKVIYANSDGVFALDRHSGEQNWEFLTAENRGGLTPPAVGNDTLVVGGGEMNVFGLDPASGEELWSDELGNDSGGVPAIVDGSAYVFDWTNEVHVFDPETGRHRYTAGLDERQFTGATVVDDVIYAGGAKGGLYALDATSIGAQLWHSDVGEGISISPAVAADRLFVCEQSGKIVSLDRETGSEIWSTEIKFWSQSAPIVVGQTVYVGGNIGLLLGFDTQTGDVVVQENVVDDLVHHLAISADTIVAATSVGTVHAFRPATTSR